MNKQSYKYTALEVLELEAPSNDNHQSSLLLDAYATITGDPSGCGQDGASLPDADGPTPGIQC